MFYNRMQFVTNRDKREEWTLPQANCLTPFIMPSSPPGSPPASRAQAFEEDAVYEAPKNHGTPPEFGQLCLLLDALQNERKQDKRRAYLTKWFNVSYPRNLLSLGCSLTVTRCGENVLGMTSIRCCV